MNRLSDIRIHTLYKIFPKEETISIKGVALVLNHIVVTDESGNMYDLGKDLSPSIAPVEPTPPEEQEPACNVPGTNVLATLLRGVDGVDGVTPDMSDYYDKNVVDAKLATKQNVISDISTIRENASKGATAVQPSQLANVATSGNYKDLSDKPYIPAEVTKQTVQEWGFGTYTKPSDGIPANDLNESVKESLRKADSALQSVPVEYITESELSSKGYATSGEVTEGLSNKVDKEAGKGLSTEDFTTALKNKLENLQEDEGVEELLDDIEELRTLISKKQDLLKSGTTLKTIFGKDLLGEGDAFEGDTIGDEYIPESIARRSDITQSETQKVVSDTILSELKPDVYYELLERNSLVLPQLAGESKERYRRWMLSVILPNARSLNIPYKVHWSGKRKPNPTAYALLEMSFTKDSKGNVYGEWKSYDREHLSVTPEYVWLTDSNGHTGDFDVHSNVGWNIK